MDTMLAMCTQNRFVATCVRAMGRRGAPTMTGQRFLQLTGAQRPDDALETSLNIPESAAQVLKESCRLGGPVKVGVDEILLERYDGKKPAHKGGKRKNGTNRFVGYVTMQVVSHRDPVTVGGCPVANGTSLTHYPGGLIENALMLGVDVGMVLLDRGFNSVDNIPEMESPRMSYAMPPRGRNRLNKIPEVVDAGGDPVREYAMTNREGRRFTSTLVVCRRKNARKNAKAADRYVAFITNIKMDNPLQAETVNVRDYVFKIGAGTPAVKAAYFDGKKLEFRDDFPDPEPGESLVRVTLAGICGTDLEMLDGYMDFRGILGHEFVGVVEKSQNPEMVGKRVVGEINVGCGSCGSCDKGLERHCPARTVLGILKRNGAFAELLSLPDGNLHVVPDSVSDQQAVFVEPLAAAFEIAEQVRLRPDWDVAVVGDGRLAQLVSRVLKLHCENIVCFGRHRVKLVRMEEMGIRTKVGADPGDNYSFDLVVEATGSHSGFSDAVNLARPRGVVVLKSTTSSRESLDITPAVVNEVTLVGSRCGVFEPAIEALATGMISVDDLVDSTYPLEGVGEAVEYARKPGIIKVLLKP